MRKTALLLTIIFACQLAIIAQSCLQEGIEFTTQTQIDSFQINFPNCIEIKGDVIIGEPEGNYSITNLDSLIVLKSIHGLLDIISCENLNNLNGLDSLESIGSYFTMWHNGSLNNLSGLKSLTFIGDGLDIGYNEQLISLEGLQSLTTVEGYMEIIGNTSLTNLNGLDSLTTIDGILGISTNANLVDISGIKNIDPNSIWELLSIRNNYSLSDCAIYSICEYIASPNGLIVIEDNAEGCNSQIQVESACPGLQVSDIKDNSDIVLFPNPAKLIIKISTKFKNLINLITIYNLQGQELISQELDLNIIDVSKLKTGSYIICIESENNRYFKKLMIE